MLRPTVLVMGQGDIPGSKASLWPRGLDFIAMLHFCNLL